jgi:hypothetical protein
MLEESSFLSDIKSEHNDLVSNINCSINYGVLDDK